MMDTLSLQEVRCVEWFHNATIAEGPMATLTIKGMPDGVVRKLKAQAARNRRSLNSEIIHVLELTTRARPIDTEAELARIRARRPIPETVKITNRQLNAWKRTGRL
jgi:plasmid stability protein